MRVWLAVALVGCGAGSDDSGLPWGQRPLRDRCFPGIGDTSSRLPDYDSLDITVPRHCAGTDHQDITGIEKLVYLGDSVTAGTPPTPESQYYRNVLARQLDARFPGVEVADCSAWGATTDDLLGDEGQITACFGASEPKRSLAVMTMGGNDMFAAAQLSLGGAGAAEIDARVEQAAANLEAALGVFDDPNRFPAGVSVVFANLYEFTDGTGDMGACPAAEILGFSGVVDTIRDAYVDANEHWVRLAAAHDRDVVFSLEHFCGHGFFSDDPDNECFHGPDSERWFDGTCIHPTPEGHARLAELFAQVILH